MSLLIPLNTPVHGASYGVWNTTRRAAYPEAHHAPFETWISDGSRRIAIAYYFESARLAVVFASIADRERMMGGSRLVD